MAALHTYLNFDGNCEEAFNFYKSVFGGEFTSLMRFKDMPGDMPEDQKFPAEDNERIMHLSLLISEGYVLMGCDHPSNFGDGDRGNMYHISFSADSEDEATKVFNGLVNGGKATMPLDKTFWGSYFGMVTDKFGINWMVSFDYGEQH